jgi:hypothetical protein
MSEPKDFQHLIRLLQDPTNAPTDREAAARGLVRWPTREAVEVLLSVCQQEPEPAWSVGYAVGESIAQILIHRGEIDDVFMGYFTEAAGLAYDDTIAAHQRSQDPST